MYSENSKITTRLYTVITNLKYLGNCSNNISRLCLVKLANLQYFPLAPFARSYRVTDESFLAITAALPIFCLSYECFLCS